MHLAYLSSFLFQPSSWFPLQAFHYNHKQKFKYDISSNFFFQVLLSNIWLARNDFIFKNKPFHRNLIVKLSLAKSVEYTYLSSSATVPPPSISISLSWKKPPFPFFKLNCDGSAKDKLLGAGGLIREHNGNWVKRFSTFLGSGHILKAELWSIQNGLQLAIDLNISHIIIETNSKTVVNLINDSNLSSHHCMFSLINNCKCYLHKFEEARICHVSREGNQPADLLANWGRDSSSTHTIFHYMPSFISLFCFYDSMSINFSRSIKSYVT